MGGHCSQKLCPGGECYSSPGRRIFGSIRDQQLYRKDRTPHGLVSQAFSFSPAIGGCGGCDLPPTGHHRFLKPVHSGWCSSHRYSALAAWSPLARQNGSLPRRR